MSDLDQLAYKLRKALSVWLLPFTEENVGTFAPALVGSTIAGTFTYDATNTNAEWTRDGDRIRINGRVRLYR